MKNAILVVMALALGFTGFANAAEEEIPAKTLAELQLELEKKMERWLELDHH